MITADPKLLARFIKAGAKFCQKPFRGCDVSLLTSMRLAVHGQLIETTSTDRHHMLQMQDTLLAPVAEGEEFDIIVEPAPLVKALSIFCNYVTLRVEPDATGARGQLWVADKADAALNGVAIPYLAYQPSIPKHRLLDFDHVMNTGLDRAGTMPADGRMLLDQGMLQRLPRGKRAPAIRVSRLAGRKLLVEPEHGMWRALAVENRGSIRNQFTTFAQHRKELNK